MTRSCPRFEVLQTLAAAPSDTRAHVRSCVACHTTVAAMVETQDVLAALVRAQRSTQAADLWPGIASRLQRPGLFVRLPMVLAGLWRTGGELLRPAAVSGLAACVLGIAAGGWIGSSLQQSPVETTDHQPWIVSSLLQDPSSGLASAYGQSFAEAEPWRDDTDETPGDRDSSGTPGGAP